MTIVLSAFLWEYNQNLHHACLRVRSGLARFLDHPTRRSACLLRRTREMTDGDHACDCRLARRPLRRLLASRHRSACSRPVTVATGPIVCSRYRQCPADDRLNGEPFHAPVNSSIQPRSGGQSATVRCGGCCRRRRGPARSHSPRRSAYLSVIVLPSRQISVGQRLGA